MDIWKILEITATRDVAVIKKAYHKKLKTTRPDDDEVAFMNLRTAYEQAIEYAENEDEQEETEEDFVFFEDYEKYEHNDKQWHHEEYGHNDEQWYHKEYRHHELHRREEKHYELEAAPLTPAKYLTWTGKIDALYNDYNRRNQIEEWKEVLFHDIPYQMEHYTTCRQYIYDLIYRRYESIYLAREVRLLINDFFSYGRTPLERAKLDNDDERVKLDKLNRKIKLCETIQFNKLNPHETNGVAVDRFFYGMEQLISNLPDLMPLSDIEGLKVRVDQLKRYQIFYLPLECMHICVHFDELTLQENQDSIQQLRKRCDEELPGVDKLEIDILEAQLAINCGTLSLAVKMLKELYRKAKAKDYLSLYQLIVCFMQVDMYYEAYMFLKQLTWLNPQEFQYEMAEDICEKLEEAYLAKIENGEKIDDLEHIHMCRIYLRGNREEKAIEVLARVEDAAKYQWEYEVAQAMCIFYEESKKVPGSLYIIGHTEEPEPPMEVEAAKPVFEILDKYPKEYLSNVERLEWQELQGRYLFEQRRYKDCEELCNGLLEEYPGAYPILTLRAYADYGANVFGSNSGVTVYMDLTYLLNAFPRRKEIRQIIAQMYCFDGKQEMAAKIMEPLKDVLPDQYKFYELYKEQGNNLLDSEINGIKEIFEESTRRELDIPPVSKYRLLDLRNIFTYACYYYSNIYLLRERRDIYLFFESLKEAKYNHPERYLELSYLYSALEMKDKAAEVELHKLENAAEHEKKRIKWRLGLIYSQNFEKLKEYEQYLDEGNKHSNMGYAANLSGKYELSIHYLEEAYQRHEGRIDQCQVLANSYCQLGRFEEAIDAHLRGIKKFDLTGDSVSGNVNSYLEIAGIYQSLRCFDEMFQYVELAKQHTRSQICIVRCQYFLENFIKKGQAYEYYIEQILALQEQGKEPEEALLGSTFMAAYVLRRPEAKKLALMMAFKEGMTNVYFLIRVARAAFMENMTVDKKIFKKVESTLCSLIKKGAPGYVYGYLVEVSTALGKKRQAEMAEKELFKHIKGWKEMPDCIAWVYAYLGNYKKAFEVYNADERNKSVLHKGVEYAEYSFFKDIAESMEGETH